MMRVMKLVASLALAVALALALAPRSPQAADVDRVQRACAELRRSYEGPPVDASMRIRRAFSGDNAWRLGTLNVVDARVYKLFCE